MGPADSSLAGSTITGVFIRSALRSALRTVDPFIVRWAQRKYKRLQGTRKASMGLVARDQVPPAEPVRPLATGVSGWAIGAG